MFLSKLSDELVKCRQLMDDLEKEGILDRSLALSESTALRIEDAAEIVRKTTLSDAELQRAYRLSLRHGISMSHAVRCVEASLPLLDSIE